MFDVQNPESWKYSNTDLEAQIEQTESQIALLTQLTGISFSQHTVTTVSEGKLCDQCFYMGIFQSAVTPQV